MDGKDVFALCDGNVAYQLHFIEAIHMELKQELGRRPTYLELHLKGKASVKEYAQEFKSYIGFLHWAEELDPKEIEAFHHDERWIKEVESTVMSKSYKMVVLLYMLERGSSAWMNPVTPMEAAPFFHHYLTDKEYRKRIDFSNSETRLLWEYNEKKVSKLIAEMPMTKWSGSSKGLITFVDDVFSLQVNVLRRIVNCCISGQERYVCIDYMCILSGGINK